MGVYHSLVLNTLKFLKLAEPLLTNKTTGKADSLILIHFHIKRLSGCHQSCNAEHSYRAVLHFFLVKAQSHIPSRTSSAQKNNEEFWSVRCDSLGVLEFVDDSRAPGERYSFIVCVNIRAHFLHVQK